MTLLQRNIEDSVASTRALSKLEKPLNRAVNLVVRCFTSGHKLLVCGNGGSASDATHLATEFLCRYLRRPPALSRHLPHHQRRIHVRGLQRLPRR